jgi:hypothetical protein
VKNRFVLIIFLLIASMQFAGAQLWKISKWEVTGGIGMTQFFGDVGGYSIGENFLGLKDISYLHTRYDFNGNIKYRFSHNINGRLSLSYGKFHATDKRGSNENRPYSASTSFFEPALIGEYYFIKNKSENKYTFLKKQILTFNDLLSSFDMYTFTGFGLNSYNVKANEALASKGLPDGGMTMIIPFGLGVNFIYSAYLSFGIELGGRYAFTDYLDGFTSQYSKANDVYYLFNLTATYKLRMKEHHYPVFRYK